MRLQNEMFVIEQSNDNEIMLKLNAEHLIYKAHFPGNPITPGVCLIQIITELLQIRLQEQLTLRKIINLKFIAPISPITNPTIGVSFLRNTKNDSEVKTKGTIQSGETILTKFSLVFDKTSKVWKK